MDIPKQLWTKSGIEFVTSILGDPICLDDATSKRERLSYARASLEYNWIPAQCKKCNIFGHDNAECPLQQGVSTEGEKGKVQQNPQHRKKQPLKQRWTPKKNTNTQGVTTIDLDPSSSVVPVTDGQTHVSEETHTMAVPRGSTKVQENVIQPEENAEHEEDEIADTQLLPEDRTPICTREINCGDGDCEVTPIVVADSQQHVEVQVEQHEDDPHHQDVALVHMNSEIYSVDLDVVVQVDSATVQVDDGVGTNDFQNLLISE
ncbi:hypothetical protein IFM89_013832 [Coptis chinensis]|uniref:DUF4283 domain-containing protein n=1 Tax=Coptis chinensis TaxID=261450 RepID=A0A835LMY3_9MAGN|nr:hypothetical protein IFM89_013832 [Coptis chinensis]